jgi:hypothetical protein
MSVISLRIQVRTAWRLACGALRWQHRLRPAWPQRLQALDGVQLLCVDVFNTLLFQDIELDAVVLSVMAGEIPKLLRREGVAESGLARDWSAEMAQHRTRLCMVGVGRPEVPRRDVYAAILIEAGLHDRAAALADELLALELACHRRLTWRNTELTPLLEAARQRRIRIVAVSDSYLGAAELETLLLAHGLPALDQIYASCEQGADKFHGDLFRRVLVAEGVSAAQALHVGDRLAADVLAPRWCGIAALHYRFAPSAAAPVPGDADRAYHFGYEILGPLFSTFAKLLAREVRHHDWQRLAFVARDGDLLREVMQRWQEAQPSRLQPALDYVCLSRRATALAAARRIDAAALEQQQEIRTPGSLLARTLAYHGLDAQTLPSDIDDPRFQAAVAEAAAAQTKLLADYLQQERLGADDTSLLVDIGWRASIQQAVNRAFAETSTFKPLPACYLGLWAGNVNVLTAPATGLLGDGFRKRSLLESAPWQAALLLEPICRAMHGTVLGYARDDAGRVHALFDEGSPARLAELEAQPQAEAIRQGVLDYVTQAAVAIEVPEPAQRMRRRAQWQLLRLAWLPSSAEVGLLSGLVHTESHVADWAPSLVSDERSSPWRSPRRWLAGLASPWRGGYVAVTAGRTGGLVFLGLEALLITFPAVRRGLQAWARRTAGI